MMASVSLAKVLSSVVDNAARMRRTSMAVGRGRGHEGGSWNQHWGTPCGGGGLMASYLPDLIGQELHVLGNLGLPKGIDEGDLQRGVLVVGGGRQDYGLDLSCCDIVPSRDNMVKSAVMTGLRVWN